MATISNLKLSIAKGSKESVVTVTYDLCFTRCELLDKTTFIETVSLRGDDAWPDPDDHLKTIYSNCVQATKACISRKVVRKVSNNVLDEDDWFFNRRDEVYARVRLKPFIPSSVTVDSNIVTGHW